METRFEQQVQEATAEFRQRIAEAHAGLNPCVICRVRSGWVVLGDRQNLRGYCLLLADPVVEDINHLAAKDRLIFFEDMACLGDALQEVTGAEQVNYQILGNLCRALHAHVHPRYSNEPPERRVGPPYLYRSDPPVPFDAERDKPLMEAIARALGRRSVVCR